MFLQLCVHCVYLVGGGRVVSPVAGQTPDPPIETTWSPEQTADATEPSGHDDCPTNTHTHTVKLSVKLLIN